MIDITVDINSSYDEESQYPYLARWHNEDSANYCGQIFVVTGYQICSLTKNSASWTDIASIEEKTPGWVEKNFVKLSPYEVVTLRNTK